MLKRPEIQKAILEIFYLDMEAKDQKHIVCWMDKIRFRNIISKILKKSDDTQKN